MKELPSIFKGLKVHKIKSRRRGNQLLGYEFTFQKESTHNWIDDKYDKSGNAKKHQLAVKYLTGMTLIIKRNYSRKPKELERIKQESLDKMKNLAQKTVSYQNFGFFMWFSLEEFCFYEKFF